jgi:hypothetical protein
MRPRTWTKEVLSEMSDDQISRAIDLLKSNAKKRGRDGTRSQVELCYVQREQEWRRRRREAHQLYLRKLSGDSRRFSRQR